MVDTNLLLSATNLTMLYEIKRAEELLLKHEDDEVVLIVLLFRLRIATFMESSPLRYLILIPAR